MAKIGGYGAVNGSTRLNQTRDFIDVTNPITADASLESFSVWLFSGSNDIETIKIKVWRVNGANYDLVGSETFMETRLAGLNSYTLLTPIAVLAGDLIGIQSTLAGGIDVDASGGNEVDFRSGDATTNTAISEFSTSVGFGLCAEATGTFTGGGSSVTLTEKSDGEVEQRTISTANASVNIAGTYSGTPTTIEARILDASDDVTEITTWAVLDAAPAGDVFSGNVTVPEGGYYHAQVRFSNDTGINNIHANDWGVGDRYAGIGQSQMENWNTDGTGTPGALISKFVGGSWSKHSTVGSGQIAFLNAISAAEGIPVAIINYAVGATGLVSGVTSPYWGDPAGSLYLNFKNAVLGIGGKIAGVLWAQGEQDAFVGSPTATEANYASTLNSLITQIRADLTNGSDQPSIPFIISQLGRATNGATDTNTQAIKNALHTVATSTADCYLGATTHDFGLSDTVHFTPAAYATHGTRMAQAVLDILGLATYHRGAQVASAFLFDSTTVDVTVSHSGGTDFTPTTAITDFEVFDDAVPVTVSAAVRLDANTIRLTVTPAITGTPTARYMYGVNPDISGVVLDNSTLNLPLEERDTFAVDAQGVVTGSGSHQSDQATSSGSGVVNTEIAGSASHASEPATQQASGFVGEAIVGTGSHQAICYSDITQPIVDISVIAVS